MSDYRYYLEARDTAWRALLRLPDKRLPVDAQALAQCMGMDTLPFPEAEENPRLRAMLDRAGEGNAISLRIKGKWYIFLRMDKLDDAEKRFAVAHEMGHLLLGHETRSLSPGVRAFESRENQGDLIEDPQDLDDYAADMFAIRLLAPAFLLHALHMDTPEGIMNLCGMPPRAAAMRANRMEVLNERDAFLSHPLERQLNRAFQPYLLARQGTGAVIADAEQGQAKTVPLVLPEKKLHPDTPRPIQAKGDGDHRLNRQKAWRWGLAGGALAAIAALILFISLR